MASIPEIYSLPQSQTRDLGRCTDQDLLSSLRNYRASGLKVPSLREFMDICSSGIDGFCDMDVSMENTVLLSGQVTSALSSEIDRLGDNWYLVPHDSEATGSWKTDHGAWSPKKLVSIRNTSQGKSPNSAIFMGAKTTMGFKPTDGSKAVVGMTRYNLFTTRDDGDGLDLEEDLALCHVFPLEGKGKGTRNRNGKRSRSGYEVDPHEPITHDGMEELDQMMSNSKKYPILDVGIDVHLLLADQPPKHWQSFTKIHTKNPKLMYAACNHCDTMLKLTGGAKCGTGSLKHHSDSCRCKPKQESLPGNSSSMHIQSIALQAITE